MKKAFSLLLFATLLVGCSDDKATSDESTEGNRTSSEEVSSQESSIESKPEEVISELNQTGEITKDGEVMYTVTATEVADVTEEATNELINDTNYLDYASNGQGQQAVKVTLLMENMSGEVVGMPYLDNVKVIDSEGVTNVGGWKDESGLKTDFGFYSLDENLNAKEEQYTVQDGESRMATSTVVLANNSEKIKFEFESQLYGDSILFELPVE